ncbi:EAL domain-containing protein [Shewanella psychrotolerans]|uniref:EAL domain-containing protein n=1 Tax=Shewanella psychrotolerans TaxID=2864206 RepID=UPI001C65D9C8|nr:EAL domain-containing protein [Shewanella psychrotolerans]QYJ99989.1 EAL domain-containing protein [Shewanella psychrotolerans]
MINLCQLYLSCEYQPLVDVQTGDIFAYEALSRFYDKSDETIAPNLVFDQLHHNLAQLGRIEFAAKHLQLKHAPKQMPLFINLDPHAINSAILNHFIKLFRPHPAITIEIIENTCVNDAKRSLTLATHLQDAQINVALDDIGAPHAMLSLPLMAQIDCLKFDRSWLAKMTDSKQRNLLNALIKFGKSSYKTTVLEGIETSKDLLLAKELSIDLVQGFLYRPQFINPPVRLSLATLLSLI